MSKNRKLMLLTVLLLGVVIVVFGFYYRNNKNKGQTKTSSSTQVFSKKVNIGKSFEFNIKNSKGEKTDKKIVMTITQVERTNQILLKGQTLTAKAGKIFILVHMELNNKYQEKLLMTPKDLIRLLDSEGKPFASDVHNSTVDVEPISIKRDRVGFLVDDTLRKFKLQIGEIVGDKELIQVNF